MPPPVISVQNISKKYRISGARNHPVPMATSSPGTGLNGQDEFWALKNISFDVHQGEVLGIIGKNGSGKSTLLKILSGITKPTSGSARIKGTVSAILEVGFGFHPDLSGLENIYLYGRMIGMSRTSIDSRVEEIVKYSGIGKFIHEPVKFYSNGMYLRLAVAVVIYSDVKILLLDEVLSVGDAEFRRKTAEKIQSILDLNTGITILLVSHSMNEVLQLCNRCILLEDGGKVFDGKVSEVVGNYIETTMVEKADAIPGFLHEPDSFAWEWHDMEHAPGNDSVRMHKVEIKAKRDGAGNVIYIEDDVEVEVQFWKLQKEMTIQLMLLFHNMTNLPVFYAATVHNKSGIEVSKRFRDDTGLLSMKCLVNGNFFNHGNYSMQIRFGRDSKTELYMHKELFHFKVQEDPAVSYFNLRDMQVALRPSFLWTYDKVSPL